MQKDVINFFGVDKEMYIRGLCSVDIEKILSHKLLRVLLLALPAVCTVDFPLTVL